MMFTVHSFNQETRYKSAVGNKQPAIGKMHGGWNGSLGEEYCHKTKSNKP